MRASRVLRGCIVLYCIVLRGCYCIEEMYSEDEFKG